MKRHLALAGQLLGLAVMLIPLAIFFKTSASDSTLNILTPPLARLGDRTTVHAQGRSAPVINLTDGREAPTTYTGNPEAQRLLQQNLVQPLAIGSSDFDEDGVPDLVCGYAAPGGGILTLHRGNVDAIYPNATEAQQRKTGGTLTDAPFLSPARAFETPRPADFIGCGDFDADGHYDVVTAARGGSTLYFFLGDGRGNLSGPRHVELPGRVTAMVAGEMDRADGLTDIVVGISGADGAKALVLEAPEGALGAIPETFSLSTEATSLVLGQFDNDSPFDLAVASGRELTIVRGQAERLSINEPDRASARAASIERRSFAFEISALAVGDFTGHHHDDLAILGQNGTVHLLSRPDAVSPAKARKSALLQRWLDEALPDSWPEARQLVRAHASSMPADDLVVIDSKAHQLQLVQRQAPAQKTQTSSLMSESLDVDGEPIAVLPMRLNADALSDLVILRRNGTAPAVVTTQAAMTFTAINNADNGVGSLRQAIIDANTNPGADTINFAISVGLQTINLTSPLPAITEAVTIDGTTQPGFVTSPLIELNGNAVPAGGSGLSIISGNCTVRALVINRFIDNAGSGGGGIVIQNGGNNLLEGNFIGTDSVGGAAQSNFIGVFIANSNVNTVGGLLISSRNVISGNTAAGLLLVGSSTGNQIQGNFIGTNAAGTADLGNGLSGVQLEGITNNTVGGTIAGARNIISGNGDQGMLIRTSAAANLVLGNFIGTDVTGAIALANNGSGVFVQDAANNTIGGVTAGARNLISGNGNNGIEIVATTGTLVQGNLVGTNAAGTAAIPNTANGMRVVLTTNNTIGGTAAGARNVISGNGSNGVILESGGDANTVQGNFIGTNAAGTAAIPNTFHGVAISSSANNAIGGTTAPARNIISGNSGGAGVFLLGSSAGNQIRGNFIGTDVTGTAALANNLGVQFEGVTNNTLGGTVSGARNIISGNIGGVLIRLGSSGIIVQSNFIGTDVSGNTVLGNNGNGVTIQDGTTNTIGGTAAFAANLISGNGGDGLGILGGSGNTVQGNLIGTNAAGNAAVPNVSNGVSILSSTNNLIGGTAAGAANLISGNGNNGLGINGGSNNTVQGNFIGTSGSGATILSNAGNGVAIGSSTNNTIGGATTAARNLLSGNGVHGIVLATAADGNTIQGNFIGVDVTGNAAIANVGSGITIFDSSNVIINGNVISGNNDDGVHMDNTAPGGQSNTVRGNFIGTNPAGTVSIPNADNGVVIFNMPNNIIGGTTAAERNIISGNGSANPTSDGVEIGGNLATGTQVLGNFIGTDVTGTADLGNSGSGVLINDAPNNTIGGASAGARNLISGNDQNGMLISGSLATGNQVQFNFIGTDASGNLPLANSLSGVVISTGSSNNVIGGAGTGNTIAFNGSIGVDIASGAGNSALSNSIFSNLGLGINLNDDGGAVTPNDNCDGDSGSNNLQNFPLLTTANSSPGNTSIVGTLNSTTATTFRIEFFSNAACDPSGNGEGQTFIGFTNVATPGACDVAINVSFPVTVPAGSVITATATDPLNNTSEFSPCVTVTGVLVCTLTCPPDLIAFTSPISGVCAAVVTYAPATSGACGTVTCAPPSGSVFAVGTTAVSCSTAGSPSCSFSVTVVDDIPPISTCPTGISTTLPKGQSSAVVNYPVATATDNCGAAAVICTPPPGSTFPVGSTLITCKATDAANNESLCFFFVTLFDGEVPVIVCPPNVNVSLPVGQTSTIVNFPPPTVTDNLPGASVVCSPRSGSNFPVGTTTVVCTATDTGGNKSSCSFIVSVGGAQAKVTLPGNKPNIDFAAAPTRKPPKPKNNPCTFFTVQNVGFAPLILTFDSLARTGSDVDSGRTTDPIDTRFFTLSLVNSDQSLTPFEMGAVLTLQPGQSQNMCLRFSALIPALAGKTTGLSASNVLPDVLTSQLVFRQNGGGANIVIPLVARVPTGLVLVNLDNPRAPAEVIFTRSGNDITVSYAVFDSNLDVSRAKYEFLNGNGQVVAGPFDVDLSGPVRSLNLVRGQSFRVDQRFTGASSHPEITSVRLTVFDGETSVGTSSTASATPISAARVQLINRARRVTLYLPDVTLRPKLP